MTSFSGKIPHNLERGKVRTRLRHRGVSRHLVASPFPNERSMSVTHAELVQILIFTTACTKPLSLLPFWSQASFSHHTLSSRALQLRFVCCRPTRLRGGRDNRSVSSPTDLLNFRNNPTHLDVDAHNSQPAGTRAVANLFPSNNVNSE